MNSTVFEVFNSDLEIKTEIDIEPEVIVEANQNAAHQTELQIQDKSKKALNEPESISVLTYSYTCSECKKEFDYEPTLKKHLVNDHGISNNVKKMIIINPKLKKLEDYVNDRNSLKQCNLCDFSSLYTTSLNIHKRREHPDFKAYKCDKCPATYRQIRNLQLHEIRVHTILKPYQCNVGSCEMSFDTKREQRYHIRSCKTKK